MAWREILYKDISLLWEHNEFTYYFNSMDNITLVFCTIHVTIQFSRKRQASAANGSPDLHTYWRFYSSLNTLSMIFLILFAPNTTMVSIAMTVKYRLMWVRCVPHRRDISLCMILRYDISLKELEHSLNVKKYLFWNGQGICQKLFP